MQELIYILNYCKRGSLYGSLIFFAIHLSLISNSLADSIDEFNNAITAANQLSLSQHPTWKSLLHFKSNKCYITDSSFLLSGESCSLEKELDETIKSFYASTNINNSHTICKFPARYLFIKENLKSLKISLPSMNCSELSLFQKKAPADKISLVFSSENVTQPSSMMGHVFLKLSGINDQGKNVEHAVSYFTRIDSINLPLLFAESMFLGMPSFYTLIPYSEQLEKYLHDEQRNVWEYDLNLSHESNELIHLHIWELKDIKSKYLFAGYNCATVIYFILSLADSHFLDINRLWISPLDVVKQSKKDGLIGKTSLIPSDKWKIRMLASNINKKSQSMVYETIKQNDFNLLKKNPAENIAFLEYQLGKSFSSYLSKNGEITNDKSEEIDRKLTMFYQHQEGSIIDVSKFKDPILRQEDSQYSLGYLHREGNLYLKLNFLPASHKLTDNNQQLFSESSLELGDVTILVDSLNKNISIDEIKLFSSGSYIPWDSFTGGLSGRFGIGVERHYNNELNSFQATQISGGFGISNSIHEDILLHSIGNIGVAYGNQNNYIFSYPEVGLIINEVFNMKSIGTYKFICGQDDKMTCYHKGDLSHSIFINSKTTLLLTFNQIWSSNNSEQTLDFSLRRYF